MKTMTIEMAARACGGRLVGCDDSGKGLGRAIIDSRAVQAGDLFVAYKGENTDGHRFIGKAFENGAVCALAEYLPDGVEGAVIICDSVQTALEKIAFAYRQSLDIPVVGITGSVGKTTAKEMIQKTIKEMKLPAGPAWPFVKLAAKQLGHFNLTERSPLDSLKSCKVPVIFFHGEDDNLVPCEMSRRMFQACPTRKMLVTVPGAGHGLSYLIAPEAYLQAMRDFFGPLEQ